MIRQFILLTCLPLLICLTFLLGGCVELERHIEVTPGTVPPQIVGARWPGLPIAYCIVRDERGGFLDHETFIALTQQAMNAWGVPTAYEGECSGPAVHGNERNEIAWGDLEGDPNDMTEAGQTNLRYVTPPLSNAPDIIEADVTIHREPARGKDTEECLYTTLLHETGHVLGLQHLTADTIMSPVITECLQEPTAADRSSLDELY